MMPYFDKLEDYRGTIPIVANYSPPLPKPFSRGSNGPLKTVVGGDMAISPLCAYFISSAVAAGFPLATLGFNDAEAVNRIGVGFYEFNIRNGIRDSVAKALLSSPPQQEGGTSTIPSNLIIRTDATVHRVIFETLTTVPRAVGVEYYSNDEQTVGGSFRRHVRLRSSRSVSNLHPLPIQHDPEVILSAGAILSSQILANSGISKGGFLVDSPNVGNNLQDHPVVAVSYRVMGDLSNSISSFFQMDGSNSQLSFETYLKSFPNNNHSTRHDATNFLSSTVYGTAGFSVGGFLSSPWSKDGDHVPDIQITVFPHTREPHFMHNNHNLTLTAQQSSHNNTNSIANVTGTNILITVALLQPESRNSLVMAAAAAAAANDTTNSPEQSWSSLGNFPLPQIQGGSLTNGDASRLAWGIKQVRNIMSTSPLKDVIQYEQRPGDQCTQDQDLIQYVKDNVMRNAHWSGSTRMGNDDDDESDSVVDSRLRVRGVESLRIVDAGVMPLIPNGNTHSTTCVIALRAVDLILDQGLKE
jgi:choline dehydrogenase-like flavoprotein